MQLVGLAGQLVDGFAHGRPIIHHHQRIVGQIVEQAVGALVDERQVKFGVGKRPCPQQMGDVVLPTGQLILFVGRIQLQHLPQLHPIGGHSLAGGRDEYPLRGR